MILKSKLVVFAMSGVDGYVLVDPADHLPYKIVYQKNPVKTSDLAKELFKDILGIDTDRWPIIINQSLTTENWDEVDGLIVDVIYSVYLEGLTIALGHKWKKISELQPENLSYDYEIIREVGIKRHG